MIFLKSFIKSLIIASFFAMIVGFTVYSRVDGTEVDIDKLKIDPKPTIIYDKNGKQLAKFIKKRQDVTEYKDIPQEMVQALLSTEDRDFYDHVGVNPRAILRAVIHDVRVGSFEQGGSTITQQLVKNIYLTSGKTIDRKQKEAIYATAIEGQLSKEQILTYYMNHADFIYNSFGVRNAIETYYGQSLDEFKKGDKIERISKSALLMGLLQSPTDNNPFTNPENALSRRNIVIHNMRVQKYITKEEYDEAIKKPLLVLDSPKYQHDDEGIYYPEVVSYVLEELRERYNLDSVEDAKYVGATVHTSFDPKVYDIMRKVISKNSLYPKDLKDGTQVQSSMTIVNPQNGEILALTGGRQAPGFLEFNRAYQGQFQPGSTFKPIIAYAPALETGKFTPSSILPGNSGMWFGGNYVVRNFGGQNFGSIPMTTALTKSANVSAVYLLQQTGIKRATAFAAKQGVILGEEDKYLPIALGGLSIGVNTLDMADAYQGFANGGYRVPAHIISKLVSHEGKVLYETPKQLSDQYRTMKKKTADYMKYMLRNGVLNGTGANANIPDQFVAGKTGTAELAGVKGRNQAIWFTGFTKSFVGSIWMGYDNPSKKHSLSNQDTSWIAARMFGEISKEVLKLYPSPLKDYKAPKETRPEAEKLTLAGYYDEENNQINLSWNKLESATYVLYRNGEKLHESDGQAFHNITIDEGQTYTYKVVAVDKFTEDEITSSNEVTVTATSRQSDENTDETEETTDSEENNDSIQDSNASNDTNNQTNNATDTTEQQPVTTN